MVKTKAKGIISTESQGFEGKLIVLCIKGGLITMVEQEEMQKIINDAEQDAAKSGVKCHIEHRTIPYCDFLKEYDDAGSAPRMKTIATRKTRPARRGASLPSL